jgi:protein dithiol:quinone oxidoreductase
MSFPARPALLVVSAACVGAVAAAVWTQYHLDMQPCPWCILQRILFIAIGAVCLVAAAQPWALLRRLLSVLVVGLCGAGVAAAYWQHFVAAKSSSCALTLADKVITALGVDTRWPDLFEVRASCADAAANLLGVPFEFWSLALFALVAILALISALTPDRRHA